MQSSSREALCKGLVVEPSERNGEAGEHDASEGVKIEKHRVLIGRRPITCLQGQRVEVLGLRGQA